MKTPEQQAEKCPTCGRMVEEGVADYGRLRSWYCVQTEGGCGTLIREEPREDAYWHPECEDPDHVHLGRHKPSRRS